MQEAHTAMAFHQADVQLQHDRLATLLEEFEREQGAIDPLVMEEVRRTWPASQSGVPDPRLWSGVV